MKLRPHHSGADESHHMKELQWTESRIQVTATLRYLNRTSKSFEVPTPAADFECYMNTFAR